jgi:hypothetical protein
MCTAPVKTKWRNSGDIAEPNLEVTIFEKKASSFSFSRQNAGLNLGKREATTTGR